MKRAELSVGDAEFLITELRDVQDLVIELVCGDDADAKTKAFQEALGRLRGVRITLETATSETEGSAES